MSQNSKLPADSVKEMGPDDVSKPAIRDAVWKYIEECDLADFPRPVYRRIPNVKGAATAAELVPTMQEFKRAQTVKINPDKPQEQARFLTLDAGKNLLVPTPRLRAGLFNKITPPEGATKDILRICSTSQGVREYSKTISLDDKVKIDLVIIGSVAVSKTGLRIGKGEGFADLEWAMMMSMGAVTKDTIVITTVHDCQIVDIPESLIEEHDLTVDYIVTPSGITKCNNNRSKPTGIIWSKLEHIKLKRVPVLRKLMLREKEAGKDVRLKDGEEFDVEAAEKEDQEREERRQQEDEEDGQNRRRREREAGIDVRLKDGEEFDVEAAEKEDQEREERRQQEDEEDGQNRRRREREAGIDVRLKDGEEFDVEAAEKEDQEREERRQQEDEEDGQNRRRRFNRYRRGPFGRFRGRGRGRGRGGRGGSRGDRTESEGADGEENEDRDGEDGEGKPQRRPNRRFRRRNAPRRSKDAEGEDEGGRGDEGKDDDEDGKKKNRRPMRRFRPRRGRQPSLFVGGLPRSLRVSTFKTEVRGRDVDPLRVIWHGGNGHAFLQFENQDLMESALKALDELNINGKKLRVEEARQSRNSEEKDEQNGEATEGERQQVETN